MTLIEVLVALTVLVMVATTIWTATTQTSRTRDAVLDAHDRLHQVRVAFDFLERDLSSAFLSRHRATIKPTHDTVFIGEDHGNSDTIDFAAFSHQRRYLDAKESDQCEVGYFLEDDREESGVKNLVRRESPILDEKALEGGQYLILLKNVISFDLTYFDIKMNQWQNEWDTTETTAGTIVTLPNQVRIKIVVQNRKGKEVAYGTQIPIPLRTPIYRPPFIPGPPIQEAR